MTAYDVVTLCNVSSDVDNSIGNCIPVIGALWYAFGNQPYTSQVTQRQLLSFAVPCCTVRSCQCFFCEKIAHEATSDLRTSTLVKYCHNEW